MSAGEISAQRVAQVVSGRPLLLVLDTCQHVIDSAAELAKAMLQASSAVHIIATSREPLLVEGEQIYKVPPLAVPATVGEDVWQCSAVQLFAVRARASGARFPEHQRITRAIAAICRQLDGIPLAIELAAARTATFGIECMAALLGDRFDLLGCGRRTALPRHQTLRAMLDWSYELLPRTQRLILHRLAIFAGLFSLEAASAVANCSDISPSDVIAGVANLAAKSLVVAEVERQVAHCRLLDTTRAYALEKLRESDEFEVVARRHAEYYRDLFERAETESQKRQAAEWLADYEHHIDDVRAALDWAFSPNADAAVGITLTAAAAPLWMHLSLVEEGRGRVEKALAVLGTEANPDARREMKLQFALGTWLVNTRGTVTPDLTAAWTRALGLAESLGDAEYRLRSLWGLWSCNLNTAGPRGALALAQRFSALAAKRPGLNDRLVGERITGITHFYLGDQASARRHLERALADDIIPLRGPHLLGLQSGTTVGARTFLAWVRWLQGFPEQAMRIAESSVQEARATTYALSLCFAVALGAFPIALWVGDLAAAARYLETLLDYSTKHALTRWCDFARGLQGVLLIRRGDVVTGLPLLSAGVAEHGRARMSGFLDLMSRANWAIALGRAGQIAEGFATIEEALARTEQNEECWLIAELLRIKGKLHLLQHAEGETAAKDLFRQALEWARRQGALSCELRVATSYGRLLRDRGHPAEALALLQPLYDRFTGGFETADLKAARALLDAIRESGGKLQP